MVQINVENTSGTKVTENVDRHYMAQTVTPKTPCKLGLIPNNMDALLQCQIHKRLTDWYVYCVYSTFNTIPYQKEFVKMLHLIKLTLLANNYNYIGFHSN